MKRRTFFCGLTLGTFSVPLAVKAQQAPKIAKIGVLFASTPAAAAQNLEAFRHGLRELGYVGPQGGRHRDGH